METTNRAKRKGFLPSFPLRSLMSDYGVKKPKPNLSFTKKNTLILNDSNGNISEEIIVSDRRLNSKALLDIETLEFSNNRTPQRCFETIKPDYTSIESTSSIKIYSKLASTRGYKSVRKRKVISLLPYHPNRKDNSSFHFSRDISKSVEPRFKSVDHARNYKLSLTPDVIKLFNPVLSESSQLSSAITSERMRLKKKQFKTFKHQNNINLLSKIITASDVLEKLQI